MKRKRACSVAISYATGDKAPIIVASGTGAIAEKIVEIAKKFDIALVQDELLARVLSEHRIGACIPPETYQVVSAIFAFLYTQQ